MEPLISPWLVYLIGISDSVATFFCVIGTLLIVLPIILLGPILIDGDYDKKYILIPILISCFSLFVLLPIGILIPDKDTIYKMIAAKHLTTDNINKIISTGKDLKTTIKSDILEIIKEIKKEEKE